MVAGICLALGENAADGAWASGGSMRQRRKAAKWAAGKPLDSRRSHNGVACASARRRRHKRGGVDSI